MVDVDFSPRTPLVSLQAPDGHPTRTSHSYLPARACYPAGRVLRGEDHMPRVNRAIELLSSDQPIYYNSTHDLSFESGKAMADTWADFINIDMEHHPFDTKGLTAFMEGLVAGGPNKSGHPTPTRTP